MGKKQVVVVVLWRSRSASCRPLSPSSGGQETSGGRRGERGELRWIDQNMSSITCPYVHQFWHEPHLWMDYETVTSNVSQLERLKLIQLEGFTNEEDDQLMMLMNLLLRQPVALKSMTVGVDVRCDGGRAEDKDRREEGKERREEWEMEMEMEMEMNG
ncbi:hypothetical protein RHGRI_011647 [Rhododendron griersonianum]|uniref:Uncharacterized protein n=1 Tax=Rhododendron griersonianum TaxID=479676 RepID=A0AAV6KNQ5_9ERIC|nr:hypothetical protein RHGRI_011647 [Rhododendron griersonianum]